jgi:type IV secretory pathway VirB10-like protein
MDYTPIADQNEQIESINETDEHEELNRFVENIENLAKEHQQQQLLAIEAPPPIDTQVDQSNVNQEQQSDQSVNDNQTKELNDQQMIQNNFNLFLTASNDNRNDEHMNIDGDLQLNIEVDEFYITTTTESNSNNVTNPERTILNDKEKSEQHDETNTLSSVSTKPLPSKSPLVCDSPIQSYNLRLSNDSHITNDTYSLIE